MKKRIGLSITAIAILSFCGCSSTSTTENSEVVQKKVQVNIKTKKCISYAPNGDCYVYDSVKDENDLSSDVAQMSANSNLVYKDRYDTIGQCPKEVEQIQQSITCKGCGPYEVSVRKNSYCAREQGK